MALQRGRQAEVTQVELSDIRSVRREDLVILTETRPPTQLSALRDNHHRVARAVATGLKNYEIAAMCGLSINRVSMLKQDPAFSELVAHYRSLVTAEWVQQTDHYAEIATTNMLKAEAMLSDKLDAAMENNEFLPTRDLISISRDAADRFGYGKRQTNLNVNADFAAMLEAARSRSAKARDITPLAPVGGAPQPHHPAPVIDSSPLQSAHSQEPTAFRRRV